MQSDWDELRVLLSLARAGSLGACARQLKVDPTTVARRLGALEESLAVRLVVRSPDGVRLTREGELAVSAAGKMEEALEGLRRQLVPAVLDFVHALLQRERALLAGEQ